MLIVHTITDLQESLALHRRTGKTIGLVPTMGNLHQGHLQLVKTAQQHADVIVVTLFVNPTQFGANEDFDSYPRTFQEDSEKLRSLNTDILFAPCIDEIYPLGGDANTHVHVPYITTILCGQSRPGHFDGVTTIVSKLFNITRADIAVFGEKDYQQLAVIRRIVDDLNIPIKIIGEPIVREEDGVAMSSRNGYLTTEQRQRAPAIQQTLLGIKQSIMAGNSNYRSLEAHAQLQLKNLGFRTDYFHIYHQNQFRPAIAGDTELVILVAVFLGSTRLIDSLNANLSSQHL